MRFVNKDWRACGLSVNDKEFLARVPGEICAVQFPSEGVIVR